MSNDSAQRTLHDSKFVWRSEWSALLFGSNAPTCTARSDKQSAIPNRQSTTVTVPQSNIEAKNVHTGRKRAVSADYALRSTQSSRPRVVRTAKRTLWHFPFKFAYQFAHRSLQSTKAMYANDLIGNKVSDLNFELENCYEERLCMTYTVCTRLVLLVESTVLWDSGFQISIWRKPAVFIGRREKATNRERDIKRLKEIEKRRSGTGLPRNLERTKRRETYAVPSL